MLSILSSNYLAREPIEQAMKKFAKRFNKNTSLLDIGCGYKPYASLFEGKYVGVDPVGVVRPDIIAPAWNIPVADSSFDGVILNQSLEHIRNTQETIAEIQRVLKPGGSCIITVPHTMKNHSEPVAISKTPFANKVDPHELPYWQEDYYRFTKFALVSLFQDFKIETIYETSGYAGTLFQLMNYCLSSLGKIRIIFTPIFFINNCLGRSLDILFFALSKSGIPGTKKFYDLIYSALPLNYVFIIKKP